VDAATLNNLLVQMRYPGMPKAESDITRAWIRKHGADYDGFAFNVRLGQGPDIQPGIDPATAQQFAKIGRKRVDIAASVQHKVDLVEVKPTMSFSGVGQLLGYLHLWQQTYPEIPVRRLIAVASYVDDEVKQLLINHGIEFEVLQPEVLP
jgi:hypothetical protein